MISPHHTLPSLRILCASLALLAGAAGPLLRAEAASPAGQQSFGSPGDALKALLAATKAADRAALDSIFGAGVKDLLSGDPKQDAIELASFGKSLGQYAVWVRKADDRFVLDIGDQNWPMPIPLVRRNGAWQFDTEAGKEEVLNRRIGEDELNAIGVCRVYVQAQREYAGEDRDGTGMFKYAQRIKSSQGSKDGLFWPVGPGEDPSPFGPLVADARAEGYGGKTAEGTPQPYKGYRFRILTGQGPSAAGGAYSYVINGNMVAGFALVAFPAHWGESGVMSFIVNQWGKVYECNLGEKSADLAAAMASFDPDSAWTPVPEP
jgi:Protein of unknown function (DUF2950)